MNNQIPQFVSVSDLQRNYSSLLKMLSSQKGPLFVLKKNKLEAVLVSPDQFEVLMEKIKEYEEEDALGAINIYKKEKKTKKLKRLEKIQDLFE